MNASEALRERIANGMVDNLVRNERGEPFYVQRSDGALVPNEALRANGLTNAEFEKRLVLAATVFVQPPKFPPGRVAPFVHGPKNALLPVNVGKKAIATL